MNGSKLRDMTESELRSLNILIIDELKFRRELNNQKAKAQFRVGDQVKFNSKHGLVEGIITKINHKTIHVKSKFTNWKVSPTLLEIV